jgi:hypothetical protein
MHDEIAGITLVPLIVGLVEMAKRLGLQPAWAAPLAVALGLVASVGWTLAERGGAEGLARAALMGVALGLSASGLYSGAKRLNESKVPGPTSKEEVHRAA